MRLHTPATLPGACGAYAPSAARGCLGSAVDRQALYMPTHTLNSRSGGEVQSNSHVSVLSRALRSRHTAGRSLRCAGLEYQPHRGAMFFEGWSW